jgi:dihydroflavonol-4-reductase
MSAKVFITGGTGFLGSHLIESLCREGFRVTALYRTEKKLATFLEQDESLKKIDVEWVKGDLFTNNWSLNGYDFVYHLAGHVGYAKEDRALMERVNVEGTREVLKKIQAVKGLRPRLIYSSSVVAVGAAKRSNLVLDEKSAYNLSAYDFGYFETKRDAEKLVKRFCKNGEDAIILNPSTIYGPRDMLKGSRKFQLRMARGELSVCSNGGVSVVHVQDVCDAFIKATFMGKPGQRYILSGDNITIKELLNEIAVLSNVPKVKFTVPTFAILTVGFISDLLEKIGLKTGVSFENLRVATMYHWFKNDKAKKHLDFKSRSYKESVRDSLGWAKEKELL